MRNQGPITKVLQDVEWLDKVIEYEPLSPRESQVCQDMSTPFTIRI